MALSIEDKKKIVSDVNELANNASSLVLADARGLKVSEANELRSQGHKSNVKFRVAKNTLVKLGLKGTNYEGIDEYLDGPTMLAFSYEEPGAAAKILKSFAKDIKTVLLEFNVDDETTHLNDIIKEVVLENTGFDFISSKNFPEHSIFEKAGELVHFGWKTEAIPIAQTKKTLIAKFFEAIFD